MDDCKGRIEEKNVAGGGGGSGHGPNEALLLNLSSRTEKITASGSQMKFEPRISRLQDKSLTISANRR